MELVLLLGLFFQVQQKSEKPVFYLPVINTKLETEFVIYDKKLREACVWQTGGDISEREQTNFISGEATLFASLELTDLVFINLELKNQRIKASGISPYEDIWKLGQDTLNTTMDKAYIMVKEFFNLIAVSIKFGVHDVYFDFRQDNNPLFLAISDAESAWIKVNRTEPFTQRNVMFPTGFEFAFEREYFNFYLGLFPAIREGATTENDEAIYFAHTTYTLPFGKNNKVFLLFSSMKGGNTSIPSGTGDAKKQRIYTTGFGFYLSDLFLDGLSLFLETYIQRGLAGETTIGDLKHHANSYITGIEFDIENTPASPDFHISYLSVSGDKRQDDTRQEGFISYEDNDRFKIVEGNEWGMDIDSNYHSIRFYSNFSIASFRGYIGAGWFELLEEVPLPPVSPLPGLQRQKKLGNEIDVEFSYNVNRWLTLFSSFSYLFDSEVMKLFTSGQDKDTSLFVMGFRINR